MARKKRKNVVGQGAPKHLVFEGNTPDEATFDILYQRYVKQYNATKGKLGAGRQMYLPKQTKDEFKDYYMSVVNQWEMDEEIRPDMTKADVANKIVNQMVDESIYEYTNKQARYYKKGLAAIGVKAELADIRQSKMNTEIDTLKDIIKERGKELKDEGLGSYLIRQKIGTEFFGSPS